MAHGKVRLPVVGESCQKVSTWQQNGKGMAEMVAKLPKLLDSIVGGTAKPRVILTDRGPGLYQTSRGIIVSEYEKALSKHGFRPFAGRDASWQPPDIADLLLHETVAAWVRKVFKKFPMQWTFDQETNKKSFLAKLKEAEAYINKNYNVNALSHSFPKRIKKLVTVKGRRLKH